MPMQLWVVVVFVLVAAASVSSTQDAGAARRPNIVYIMTDDQDAQLGSMDYMPLTRRLVGEEGLTFDHYYVTTSLCCPSRTSLLTGQFCHNHGLWENEEIRNGGMARFIELGLERANLATWLKEGGYTTGLFGKFLNGYHTSNVSYIPPGWDRWFVATQETISHYDKTCFSDQGRQFCPKAYQTDAIRDKAVDFINNFPSSSSSSSPFFLQITPHAPHRPCLPAARHRHLFLGAKAPRTPSFNASQRWQDTKVSWIRDVAPLTQAQVSEIDRNWVLRLQSLQAVDELVQAVVEALERRGLLNDTYVFYTSDNGWHLGQHRLQWGKRQAYEEDIRVPMLVRGPGVPRGERRDDLTANIDVTPTLLDIARVNVSSLISHLGRPVQLDGLSFLSTLSSADNQPLPGSSEEGSSSRSRSSSRSGSLRQALLVEGNFTESGVYAGKYDLYTGLRVVDGTHDLLYVDWTGLDKQELYDLTTDPYELQNIVASYPDPAFKRKLACVLNKLSSCRGGECLEPFASMCA